jgi:RNA polymerase sigma-70 factor (ECF subfamily)
MPSTPDLSASSGRDALGTSRSLLDLARHHDAQAWQRLVDLYAPLVYYWCRRSHVPEQDIADVVQEVFRSVVTGLNGFRKDRPGDTFRGWVRTIQRSKTSDYFRRQRRSPHGAGGSDAQHRIEQLADQEQQPDEADAADQSAEQALLHRGLDAIRDQFEPQVWQAFWRVVVDRRAVADVAAELGMPPGTVRVYKCRVSQRLRQALGDVD